MAASGPMLPLSTCLFRAALALLTCFECVCSLRLVVPNKDGFYWMLSSTERRWIFGNMNFADSRTVELLPRLLAEATEYPIFISDYYEVKLSGAQADRLLEVFGPLTHTHHTVLSTKVIERNPHMIGKLPEDYRPGNILWKAAEIAQYEGMDELLRRARNVPSSIGNIEVARRMEEYIANDSSSGECYYDQAPWAKLYESTSAGIIARRFVENFPKSTFNVGIYVKNLDNESFDIRRKSYAALWDTIRVFMIGSHSHMAMWHGALLSLYLGLTRGWKKLEDRDCEMIQDVLLEFYTYHSAEDISYLTHRQILRGLDGKRLLIAEGLSKWVRARLLSVDRRFYHERFPTIWGDCGRYSERWYLSLRTFGVLTPPPWPCSWEEVIAFWGSPSLPLNEVASPVFSRPLIIRPHTCEEEPIICNSVSELVPLLARRMLEGQLAFGIQIKPFSKLLKLNETRIPEVYWRAAARTISMALFFPEAQNIIPGIFFWKEFYYYFATIRSMKEQEQNLAMVRGHLLFRHLMDTNIANYIPLPFFAEPGGIKGYSKGFLCSVARKSW